MTQNISVLQNTAAIFTHQTTATNEIYKRSNNKWAVLVQWGTRDSGGHSDEATAWRSRNRRSIRCSDKGFFSSPKYQTGSGAHLTPPFRGYREIFPWGYRDRSVKLTAHLHLVPRLRMSGALPLLFQYGLMARTGTPLFPTCNTFRQLYLSTLAMALVFVLHHL